MVAALTEKFLHFGGYLIKLAEHVLLNAQDLMVLAPVMPSLKAAVI
jgi:hypothetical protein